MSIAGRLNQRCDTSRSTPVGTNGRKALTSHLTNVPCSFHALSPSASIALGFDVFNTFKVFFTVTTDIAVNDRITCEGVSYLVKGVNTYKQSPAVAHLEALVTTENAHV